MQDEDEYTTSQQNPADSTFSTVSSRPRAASYCPCSNDSTRYAVLRFSSPSGDGASRAVQHRKASRLISALRVIPRGQVTTAAAAAEAESPLAGRERPATGLCGRIDGIAEANRSVKIWR